MVGIQDNRPNTLTLVFTPTLGRQATRLGASPESAFVFVPA